MRTIYMLCVHYQRFFPSEFGNDVDRVNAVEPAKTSFAVKAQIRRTVEAEGIPYTYVSSNCFAAYFLPVLCQPGVSAPPRDKVTILGDGKAKGMYKLIRSRNKHEYSFIHSIVIIHHCLHVCAAVFNNETDIGTYTIKAVDDPRTLNKVLYIRPPKNTLSFNELVALWESKIGKTLEKTYIPEEQVLKDIQGLPPITYTYAYLYIDHFILII